MKTAVATLLFLVSTLILNASEVTGEQIYEVNCKSCHTLQMPKEMSKPERMKMMKEMKAPPLSKISAKIKDAFDNNESKFIAFVEDYIQNPDANKSLCMPMAIKRFGVMPPIGKELSQEERQVISQWLYKNFDEEWSHMPMGGMMKGEGMGMSMMNQTSMEMNNSAMPKMNSSEQNMSMMEMQKNTMKCAAGRCGSGKCGGGK